MRKLLSPLLFILLFTGCKKEIGTTNKQEEIATATANRTSPKITIWHYHASTGKWKQITINLTGWPEHRDHGDIGYIGYDYQGGKIAYFLQPGDPGYDANVPHGLIAAAADQSTEAQWGCFGTPITGADGRALGTGNQNTIDIMAGCATAGIAARLCGDLSLNGYSDWYLPSWDELNKLYINRVAIGGFDDSFNYCSSSEQSINLALFQYFLNGLQFTGPKYLTTRVRAVRSF